ncbi:hypothetical protein [Zhongshania sp. BJYM1]|uniref:hypothetical protein n=1 Tax=Zhongshania aquatica TaxID=2965069 RepID=UPI0022B3AAA5|nr:hypothetical protein [Marortus sp. BJYM1]
MNEALRLDYLQAMGVDSYVPRFVLDGAASSPLCDIDFAPLDDGDEESIAADGYENGAPYTDDRDADSHDIQNEYQNLSAERDRDSASGRPASSASQQVPSESRARIASDLDALNLDGKASKRPPVSSTTTPTAAEGENATPVANPAFNVEIVGTGIGVLFVVDTTHQPLNPAEKRLLANIAIAITSHHKLELAPSFSSARFQWPVLKTPSFARDADAAKDALLGNVMAHAERQNAHCVIVLGDNINSYFDRDLLASSGLTAIFSVQPALMLEDGSKKAELWAQLRGVSFLTKGTDEA